MARRALVGVEDRASRVLAAAMHLPHRRAHGRELLEVRPAARPGGSPARRRRLPLPVHRVRRPGRALRGARGRGARGAPPLPRADGLWSRPVE